MEVINLPMTDSSKLCISCGLCCDGTLIGHVQLADAEIARVKTVMEIEDENGNGFFMQPCKKYCDGCTIYEQRPSQCGIYKCELLNSFEEKELTFVSADELIVEVKKQRNTIAKKIDILGIELKSPSFNFKIVELKKLLLKNKQELSLTHQQEELMTDLEQLNKLTETHFGVTLY